MAYQSGYKHTKLGLITAWGAFATLVIGAFIQVLSAGPGPPLMMGEITLPDGWVRVELPFSTIGGIGAPGYGSDGEVVIGQDPIVLLQAVLDSYEPADLIELGAAFWIVRDWYSQERDRLMPREPMHVNQ